MPTERGRTGQGIYFGSASWERHGENAKALARMERLAEARITQSIEEAARYNAQRLRDQSRYEDEEGN
jgi:hypothetical protein